MHGSHAVEEVHVAAERRRDLATLISISKVSLIMGGPRRTSRRRKILRRGRLTAVAVVALGLFAVAGAGAATGILSRDDAQPPPPAEGEVVLASGEAPVGGPWRLTTTGARPS